MKQTTQPHLVNIVLDACNRSGTDKMTFGIFQAMKMTGMIGKNESFSSYDNHPVSNYLHLAVGTDVQHEGGRDAFSCLVARGGSYTIGDVRGEFMGEHYR